MKDEDYEQHWTTREIPRVKLALSVINSTLQNVNENEYVNWQEYSWKFRIDAIFSVDRVRDRIYKAYQRLITNPVKSDRDKFDSSLISYITAFAAASMKRMR